MNTEEFASLVRGQCVDELVDVYAEMLSTMAITRATDPGMRELAELWKAASPEMQAKLKQFIRLGSQNTAAKVLALLDEDLGHPELNLPLMAIQSDGSLRSVSRDLLSHFWSQEEDAGRVNQHRPGR
jgi:hypothetical protein